MSMPVPPTSTLSTVPVNPVGVRVKIVPSIFAFTVLFPSIKILFASVPADVLTGKTTSPVNVFIPPKL